MVSPGWLGHGGGSMVCERIHVEDGDGACCGGLAKPDETARETPEVRTSHADNGERLSGKEGKD